MRVRRRLASAALLIASGCGALFLLLDRSGEQDGAAATAPSGPVPAHAESHGAGSPAAEFDDATPTTGERVPLEAAGDGPGEFALQFHVSSESGLELNSIQASPEGEEWRDVAVRNSRVELRRTDSVVRAVAHGEAPVPSEDREIILTPSLMVTLAGSEVERRLEQDPVGSGPRLESEQVRIGACGATDEDAFVLLLETQPPPGLGDPRCSMQLRITGNIELQIVIDEPEEQDAVRVELPLETMPLADGTFRVHVEADPWPSDLRFSALPIREDRLWLTQATSWGRYALVHRPIERSNLGPDAGPIELASLIDGWSYLVAVTSPSSGQWARAVLPASDDDVELTLRAQQGLQIQLRIFDASTKEPPPVADVEWCLSDRTEGVRPRESRSTWFDVQRHSLTDGLVTIPIGPQMTWYRDSTWPPPSQFHATVSAAGYEPATLRVPLSYARSTVDVDVPVTPKPSRIALAESSGIDAQDLRYSRIEWGRFGEGRTTQVEAVREPAPGDLEVVLQESGTDLREVEEDILARGVFVLTDSQGAGWTRAFRANDDGAFEQVPAEATRVDLSVRQGTTTERRFVLLGWTWHGIDHSFDSVEIERTESTRIRRTVSVPAGVDSVWFVPSTAEEGERMEFTESAGSYEATLHLP